jgi:hypothetical protein
VTVLDSHPVETGAAAAQCILYVGSAPVEAEKLLKSSGEKPDLKVANGVSDALALVTRTPFASVIVDQGDEQNASALLIAMLASLKPLPRIVVIAQAAHVEKYLRLRGVHSVLSLPVRGEQLARAAGLGRQRLKPVVLKTPLAPLTAQEPELRHKAEEPRKTEEISIRVGPAFLSLISSVYKYSAFVLLSILFAAFCFYGLMIGYFLFSTGWGAPVTLSKGHELVVKADREIGDLRVNLNLFSQRLSEAELEAAKAERELEDARLLVSYVQGTVAKEIEAREAARATVLSDLKRLEKVQAAFKRGMDKGGLAADLAALYEKRLIDKRSYSAGTLGILEAEQRLAVLEGDVDRARDEAGVFETTIAMLKSLREQLSSDQPLSTITAAHADLILLTKQAIDARSALDQSQVQLASAKSRQELLGQSMKLIEAQIADRLGTPLGRAIASRIDVIFIPYANVHKFGEGTPLYSCALSIVWCHRAGKAGQPIPGEANTVHPFFGKPIRGVFIEAVLDDPTAASREIIHASRPPFLF